MKLEMFEFLCRFMYWFAIAFDAKMANYQKQH